MKYLCSWLVCGATLSCASPLLIRSGPQPRETLGGATCTFGKDRTELKWELETSKDYKRVKAFAPTGQSYQNDVPLEVDDSAVASQPFAVAAGVPYRFRLGLPHWQPLAGAKLTIGLWVKLDDGDPIKVKDSWCRVPDPPP